MSDTAAAFLAQAATRSRQIPVLLYIVSLTLLVSIRLCTLLIRYSARRRPSLALAWQHTQTCLLHQRFLSRTGEVRLGRFVLGAVPTCGQVYALGVYLVMMLAACCLGYTDAPSQAALQKAIAMRTGTLAFAQYPLLIGLVGRNDALSQLTGVSKDALQVLHRWSGRTVVLLSMVHTVAYLVLFRDAATATVSFEDKMHGLWMARFFRAGVVALLAAMVLLMGSWRFLRQRLHAFFLGVHLLAAAVFLFASLLHEGWSDNATSVMLWVYLGLGLWALDYFARLLNGLYCCLARQWPTATLTRLPGEMTQVDIDMPSGCYLTPGATVYLSLLPGWQGHPFTVLANDLSDETLVRWQTNEKEIFRSTGPTRQGSCTSMASDTTLVEKEAPVKLQEFDLEQQKENLSLTRASRIRLLVKAQQGMTRHLYNLARGPGQEASTRRVFLEGPYQTPTKHCIGRHQLLIAGGVGITSLLPAFQRACLGGTAYTVHLVWLVRTEAEIACLRTQLRACVARANATPLVNRARVTVYVTREAAPLQRPPPASDLNGLAKPQGTWQPRWRASLQRAALLSLQQGGQGNASCVSGMQVVYGRPDLGQVIMEMRQMTLATTRAVQAHSRSSSGESDALEAVAMLQVRVCGSSGLTEAVRCCAADQSISAAALGIAFEVVR